MADGRMLKRRAASSKKIADLETDTARLLWFMLLPFTDVNGRVDADPVVVKGTVCPKVKTLTLKTIQSSLDDMHRVGLIVLYEIDDESYLEFARFHDFNKINPSKEAKSHIPPPTPELLQSYSRVTPAEVKRSKEKVKRSKGNKPPSTQKKKYLDFVFLTDDEHRKLKDKLNSQIDDYIERLNNYIGSKGAKYKSHYFTILNWYRKDIKDGKSNSNRKHSLAEQESEFGQTITD